MPVENSTESFPISNLLISWVFQQAFIHTKPVPILIYQTTVLSQCCILVLIISQKEHEAPKELSVTIFDANVILKTQSKKTYITFKTASVHHYKFTKV
jgi:hypothetical protein